VVLS
jgi:hypothetical protein